MWIYLVDGGNNTDTRWSEAFEGIPETAYRFYTDPSELNPKALVTGSCY
jgi:hypothetical protein